MEECLSKAAEIRRRLEGRLHSDSTELVADDRNGTSDDALDDRELKLEDLLADATNENLHSEIDFGAPVGKEKC
jgi:antitoxin component of MazEF toxin-antitoxin module